MRLVPWLVAGAIVVSCTLPSSDEFANGARPAPDGGGGSSSSSGATDASVEASSVVDGGDEAGASCPRTAVYCNDFSSGTVDDVATEVVMDRTTTLAIEGGVLHAHIAAHPEAGIFAAGAARDLSPTARKAILELDVNVDAVDWGEQDGSTTILSIFLAGDPYHAFELYYGNGYTSVTTTRSGELGYDGTDPALSRGRWVHVKLDADFTPHDGAFHLSFDGKVVAAHEHIDFAPSPDAMLRTFIGMSRNNAPTPVLDVKYDNLVVTLP